MFTVYCLMDPCGLISNKDDDDDTYYYLNVFCVVNSMHYMTTAISQVSRQLSRPIIFAFSLELRVLQDPRTQQQYGHLLARDFLALVKSFSTQAIY